MLEKYKYRLLSKEFLDQYPDFPEHMTSLGKFVYLRTYSRWLPEEQRRETWKETVQRAVEYNCSLANTSKEEAEKLFDNIFNLRQCVSGRTLWVGGTEVAEKYPLANFNCSFLIMDSIEAIRDLFYLLMVGTGVGFRILKSDVEKFPKVRQDIKLTHKEYDPVPKPFRNEYSSLIFEEDGETVIIVVGDSKEGWVQSLVYYFNVLTEPMYAKVKEIIINYDSVRPKGERLKTFGGTASGHESLKTMFEKINNVITTDKYAPKPVDGKLRPIHLLDICNIIGENVVVGGVRRTSEIALLDETDEECIYAKSNLTPEKYHRFMSNNSIFYERKPSKEQLKWQFDILKNTGEPSFVNAVAGRKRRENFNGVNPCGEVLLDDRQTCNLTTVNVMAFVKEDRTLDLKALIEAQKLSARAGLRMTCVDLELPKWDKMQKKDRLLGCSLTGWKDAMAMLGYSVEEEKALLKVLGKVAREEANKYADELGINRPLLVTSVKPEGTLSQVFGGVSSGLHYAHSPYYIRRIRINAHDPLCKTLEECGWELKNEVGQGIEVDGKITPVMTKVIEFPVKSPVKKTKYDVSAIEQLNTYLNFQKYYTEHNSSNTITVRDNEWEEVQEYVYNNWEDIVAVTFLSLDDTVYELAPYEAITKEQYEKMLTKIKPIDFEVLKKYELENSDLADIEDDTECATGACPIR